MSLWWNYGSDMVTTEALSSHGVTETIERSATLPLRSLARDNHSSLTSQSSESKLKEKTMLVNWIKDADAALEQAKTQDKPLLIDFSAAPV